MQQLNVNRKLGMITLRLGSGYAIMLALLPVVIMYKVPIVNMGQSTVLFAVLMVLANVTRLITIIFYFGTMMTLFQKEGGLSNVAHDYSCDDGSSSCPK